MRQSTLNAASDVALVRPIAERELTARFEAVRGRLTAVCTAVVGADEAEDLVQETFLRARDRIHQLRDGELFDAWVVRIALNEALTVARRRKRLRERLPRLVAQAPAPRDVGLRELVERLQPRPRAVIVLRYAYGLSTAEVARYLNTSEANVRVLSFRARRHLQSQLEEADR